MSSHPQPVDATVAHVVLSLDVGGAEMLVASMVAALRSTEFRPHVVCLDHGGSLATTVLGKGIPVTCVGRRAGVLDVTAVARLRRVLLGTRATLVHTHDFDAFAYGGLAAWLGGRLPVIHTQHGLPAPFGWKQRCKAIALRHVVHRFVGVSDEVTAIGLESGWFVRDRTLTITNGVDVEAFRPDPLARRQTRQALGIPDQDLVVIAVARLAEIKDHVTLVRGFAASPVANTGHLLLVGDGPQRRQIEEEIARLGQAGRIRMLGGRSDVRDLLAAADVFALTSKSEGISISLLEAMATGLVPVVTAVGGNTQVVHAEGQALNGMVIAPGAVDELAVALHRISEDDVLRARLSAAARETVGERFSHQEMMARYLAAYRS